MTIREAATVVLMVVGAVLTLLAALGMVRMPDVYSRMQSATKASTLGVGCLMLAVAVDFGRSGHHDAGGADCRVRLPHRTDLGPHDRTRGLLRWRAPLGGHDAG